MARDSVMTMAPAQNIEETYAQPPHAYWTGVVDVTRTPSPIDRPSKRPRYGGIHGNGSDGHNGFASTSHAEASTAEDQIWPAVAALDAPLLAGEEELEILRDFEPGQGGTFTYLADNFSADPPFLSDLQTVVRKKPMQTGCIPCLIKGIPCDPRNPSCKRVVSDDWNLNRGEGDDEDDPYSTTPESLSLGSYRPDLKWRQNWRERHSLNFFVNFSAPQMAGFFDSTFWQRMVIQNSFHEPAILHAVTAIGALHEAIMQRAFADERRKTQALNFALSQCNKAIACLTRRRRSAESSLSDTRLALITCVLFTCFEAMQGRCDSAVNHALQGRRLLQATGFPDQLGPLTQDASDIEQMRPLVERLEVQATALLDKGKRPEVDHNDRMSPLPSVDLVYSLDHAHNTLHLALNSIMRYMQGFQPTAPKDKITLAMAEKLLRYGPWFRQWETAFTTYLAENKHWMTNMDFKRAMVLKANHLVGTMLSSVDQSAGPVAYDPYEAEFKAIVDLSREVLATFSCPPLPTLSGGSNGTPYLSFSLWVTDPLWMAISRCRNPSIRQAAFTLLSQNPRQEGIWHAGPQLSNNRYMRRTEAGPSRARESNKNKSSAKAATESATSRSTSNGVSHHPGESAQNGDRRAPHASNGHARSEQVYR